jgi:iron complex transport system permease protein
MKSTPGLFFIFLLILLAAAIILATGLGFIAVSPGQVLQSILARAGLFHDSTAQSTAAVIIVDVRLPRILTAVFVGGGLAVAGGVFQAILLNPLADPYTLGISSGAAFGASSAIILSIFGVSLPVTYSIPLFAFIGALATLAAVFYLSTGDNRLSSNTLILSGIIVAAILSAGIGFIKYLADEEVGIIIFWLMGSFVGKSWPDVASLTLILIPCLLYIFYFARDLNIMALGSKTADTLGVDTAGIRKRLLISASLVTAVCVAVSGVIGFVGLIVPHLLRMLLGPDNRILLPASFLTGALLLLLADTVTRAVLPHEIPIGILTALIGGPFFCYIFRRRQIRLAQ